MTRRNRRGGGARSVARDGHEPVVGANGSGGDARSGATQRMRAAARAGLEPLEQRILFANIVVTDLGDNTAADGKVTLREAIQAAETDAYVDGSAAGSGTDVITFDPSLTAGADATITLSQFDTGLDNAEFGPTAFILSTSITIIGPSADNGITIRRNPADANAFRLFHVESTASLTVRNLTLSGGLALGASGSGGAAGLGGAVFNQGILTINRSTLTGNTAAGGEGGGNAVAGGGVGSGPAAGTGGGPNGARPPRAPPTPPADRADSAGVGAWASPPVARAALAAAAAAAALARAGPVASAGAGAAGSPGGPRADSAGGPASPT